MRWWMTKKELGSVWRERELAQEPVRDGRTRLRSVPEIDEQHRDILPSFFFFFFSKVARRNRALSLSLCVCSGCAHNLCLDSNPWIGEAHKANSRCREKRGQLGNRKKNHFSYVEHRERERERNFSTVRKEETGYDPELSLARSSSGLFADKISVYRNKAAGNRHKEAWGVNADQQQCVYWGILALLTL